MALPERVVAEEKRFFITLGGPKVTPPVGMTRREGRLWLELLAGWGETAINRTSSQTKSFFVF